MPIVMSLDYSNTPVGPTKRNEPRGRWGGRQAEFTATQHGADGIDDVILSADELAQVRRQVAKFSQMIGWDGGHVGFSFKSG
jgi:hypothetical protein